MITATQARKTTKDYLDKLQRDYERAHKVIIAKQKRETAALWEARSPILILQIEGYIKKAAAEGHNGTSEPSDVNPNGDEVIYLDAADEPIKEPLMNYFRSHGFTVENYMYRGLKITW